MMAAKNEQVESIEKIPNAPPNQNKTNGGGNFVYKI